MMDPASFSLDSGDFVLSGFDKNIKIALSQLGLINSDKFKFFKPISTPVCVNKESYLNTCKNIISAIRAGTFDKVVLSRVIMKPINKPITKIFQELCDQYHDAFIYMISLEHFGTWVGASPERFIKINGEHIETTALAGTKTKEGTPWGEKEQEEQSIVSSFIERELEISGATDIQKKGPFTFDTGALFHIKTDFVAKLVKDNQFKLIERLHPTPATCGMPKKESYEFIKSIEQHERLLYAGFIGPVNKEVNELFVNLRCMQIVGNRAYLYVGGGITKDSDPELEWQETINKSNTLGQFLN